MSCLAYRQFESRPCGPRDRAIAAGPRTAMALFPAILIGLLTSSVASNVGPARASQCAGGGQYGVRWKWIENEQLDYDLPCERIEDAVGLSPTDFDAIFPWSDIKLCNVKRQTDGTSRVVDRSDPEFALDGTGGHVMVEIPKHYSRRYMSGGYEYRLISATPRSDFIVDPAFVENGRQIDKIYIGAYEAFVGDDGRMQSRSGVCPTADKTRVDYRKYARANGSGYGILDLRTLLLIQNLYLIEHADRNSQQALGNGWGKILQPARTCRCALPETQTNRLVTLRGSARTAADAMSNLFIGCAITITSYDLPAKVYHTGRSLTRVELDSPKAGLVSMYFDGAPIDTITDMCLGGAAQKTGRADRLAAHSGHGEFQGVPPLSSYRCAVKYRHMENLWGNVWCFIDGVNLSNGRAYICCNMDDYQSAVVTGKYLPAAIVQLLQDDNGDVGGDKEIHYLRNLGYDSHHPWLALPQDYTFQGRSSVPGASLRLRNGNFGDYYYLNTKATCYVHGGGFDHYWRCGLFTLRGWATDSLKWYLYGSRLIYKPLGSLGCGGQEQTGDSLVDSAKLALLTKEQDKQAERHTRRLRSDSWESTQYLFGDMPRRADRSNNH